MKTDREIAWGAVIREMKGLLGDYYICLLAQRLCNTGRITSAQYDIITADVAAMRERVFVRARLDTALWLGAELKERLRFARLAARGWQDLYDYPLEMREVMGQGSGWEFKNA